MRKIRALMAIPAVLAVLVMGQSPASAHGDKVYHGNDFATVAPDHMSGSVCDEESDGHWVYAVWYLVDGTSVGEFDGGDANCDNAYFSAPAGVFLICEENKGCRDELT